MHRLLLILLAAPLVAAHTKNNKVVGCYYTNWAYSRSGIASYTVQNVIPTLCTHIYYSFIGLSPNADIKILDTKEDIDNNGFDKFVELRRLSPKTKFLVSMGGWNEGSANFSKVMTNPTLRSQLVINIVDFLDLHKFDGFDLDWEYPSERPGSKPTDKENVVLFLKELREAFDRFGYILTMAVAPAEQHISVSYDISALSRYLDYINFMTYDFYGFDDSDHLVGHNTPLYPVENETPKRKKLNIDYCVKKWISMGAAPEKIVLGTAFYGKSYTLKNPNLVGRCAPFIDKGKAGKYTKEAGTLAYYEICSLIKNEGWTVVRDAQQRVPYAYKGNQLVAYDDEKSIAEKAVYVNENNLAGAMMWALDLDDFNGVCGTKNILLKTLNRILQNINDRT